jgi:hypothetical protein
MRQEGQLEARGRREGRSANLSEEHKRNVHDSEMVRLGRKLLRVGERELPVGDELEDEFEGQRGEVCGTSQYETVSLSTSLKKAI